MPTTILRRSLLKNGLLGSLAAVVAGTGLRATADEPPTPGENRKLGKVRQLVPSVPMVEVAIQEIDPPNLVVSAKGQVPTGGWRNIALVRATYDTPPEDGIVDYFFLATSPEGLAAQVIKEVSATNTWKGYTKEADWVKGVRVHGAKGSVVEMIAGGAKE